ncbi:MAG TPA: hypothetical protein VFE47_02915 [Tepidisphaeraceae bacterium]|jgi:hypothetical protein|nr:hypothetical protein [Tepidisphaeraceae bacterium]
MTKKLLVVFAAALVFSPALLLADADDSPAAIGAGKGPFGLLDPASKYYRDVFPEPFRVEDTAIDNELRFDWEHDEARGARSNIVTAEVQKSFGIVTFEVQSPYAITTGGGEDDDAADRPSGHHAEGFANVELAGRIPIYQFVSASGLFDNSIGFNLELGVPTNSIFSKNTELAPGIFDDLAIGDHFTLQTLFTFSHLFGSLQTGRDTFEYGLAFGYAIEDEEFAVPHVERLIPMVEVLGETTLSGYTAGTNVLTGTAGLRAEFKSIGKIQPQLGIGYIFPIDKGGRDQLQWGLFTSLVFEF